MPNLIQLADNLAINFGLLLLVRGQKDGIVVSLLAVLNGDLPGTQNLLQLTRIIIHREAVDFVLAAEEVRVLFEVEV